MMRLLYLLPCFLVVTAQTPEKSTRKSRDVGDLRTTGQVVMETNVLAREFNKEHTFVVSKTEEFFLKFDVPKDMVDEFEKDPDRHIFQVNAKSTEAQEAYPVDMTIRQFRQIKNFHLPLVERKGKRIVYHSHEHSVDFCPIKDIDSNSTVLVSISTSSPTSVSVTVRVLVKGKGADWKEVKTDRGDTEFWSKTTIKPVISRIRYFDSSLLNTDSIIVKVTTRNDTDCLCSIISIQQPTCPFYDEVGTSMRHGVYSTMMDQGTVIIDPEDYPQGFILVLVASADEDVCKSNRCMEKNGNLTDPRKRVLIKIASNGTDWDYALATMTVICLYLGIFALTITFSILEFRYKYSDFEQVRDRLVDTIGQKMAVVKDEFEQGANRLKEMTMRKASSSTKEESSDMERKGQDVNERSRESKTPEEEMLLPGSCQISLKEENNIKSPQESIPFIDNGANGSFIEVPERARSEDSFIASFEDLKMVVEVDTTDMKRRRRLKANLNVADLSMKLNDPTRTKSVYQKSQLYLGVLLLVSIYYSLPVLQMVFRFSAEQRFTGNQDICFYNDLCRKPLGHIRDFNHVFSNLGYVVFGALFMCIVLFKKLKYESFLKENSGIQKDEYGVPCQYGLYFAMGLSLSMEGVMSSSYHVCPTQVTLQFDTTFMYLIAVLMFMKIYQVRHADVSANAIGVFFGLGVALLLETLSIYYDGPFFWAFFCTVYTIVIVVVSVHAYNIGVVKYDWKVLYTVTRILAVEMRSMLVKKSDPEDQEHKSKARPRLLCLVLIGLINLALCLYFGISGTPGTSNYLLGIFFLNLTMYGSYYCTMKVINGEKINKIPMLYACLGLVFFIPSLYFFTKKEKSTDVSPSDSRDMNRDCQFLNFFDGHDIWHFLGAAGVFFAFLCIFTLDEDVKFKKRDSIPVF